MPVWVLKYNVATCDVDLHATINIAMLPVSSYIKQAKHIKRGANMTHESMPYDFSPDIEQLARDARKKDAWQAKLIYAKFLLSTPPKNGTAEKLLQEIHEKLKDATDHELKNFYFDATLLLEKNFALRKKSGIEIANIEAMLEQKYTRDVGSANYQSPEILYKTYRSLYMLNNGYTRDKYAKDLNFILNIKVELTDTLLAKIYFQLLRINIEEAAETGQLICLELAKRYADLLVNSPTMQEMDKAKYAKIIYDQLPAESPYTFANHTKQAFNFGKTVSKYTLKWMGLAVGTILDLTIIPKVISLAFIEEKPKYSFGHFILKKSGFMGGLQWLGERIGEHVIGNLITGPISALFGLLSYPVIFLHKILQSSPDVKLRAQGIINSERPSKDQQTSAALDKKDQANKKLTMFAYKKQDTPDAFGGVAADHIAKVKNIGQILEFPQTSTTAKTPYAYGRLFSKECQAMPAMAASVAHTPQATLYPRMK